MRRPRPKGKLGFHSYEQGCVMTLFKYVTLYYALIASPFVLAGVLVVIYLLAESIGRDVPRWGQE